MIEIVISSGVDKKQATVIVENLLQAIQDALLRGDSVNLLNVGTLTPKKQTKESRISFGKEIKIKKKINVSFRLSDNFQPEEAENQIVELLKIFNSDLECS